MHPDLYGPFGAGYEHMRSVSTVSVAAYKWPDISWPKVGEVTTLLNQKLAQSPYSHPPHFCCTVDCARELGAVGWTKQYPHTPHCRTGLHFRGPSRPPSQHLQHSPRMHALKLDQTSSGQNSSSTVGPLANPLLAEQCHLRSATQYS